MSWRYRGGLPGQFFTWLTTMGTAILAGLTALPGLLYEGLTTAIAAGLVVLYTLFVTLPTQIGSWLGERRALIASRARYCDRRQRAAQQQDAHGGGTSLGDGQG